METHVRNQGFSFGEMGEKAISGSDGEGIHANRHRRGPPANATVVNAEQAEERARDEALSDTATGGAPLVASQSMATLPEEPVERGT